MKILLVDDHEVDRGVYGGRLVRLGHDVSFATSGEEAVALVQKDCPDLIILDVQMPGMGGFGALAEIKKMPLPPRMWLHSSVMNETAAKAAKMLGADNAFSKENFADEVRKLS